VTPNWGDGKLSREIKRRSRVVGNPWAGRTSPTKRRR